MNMKKIFNSIIQILETSDEFHVPGSDVYSALEVIVNKYRKIFSEDITVDLLEKKHQFLSYKWATLELLIYL